MSFKVYIDEIVSKFNDSFKPAPALTAALPEEMIAHIFSFLDNVDASHLEQASKQLYTIASQPASKIHTPLRLTCRDLCLNLDAQIEKVSEAVLRRALTPVEVHQIGIPRTTFSSPISQTPSDEYSIASERLEELFNGFKQYFNQLKVEGKEAKLGMYVCALTKLITGSIGKDGVARLKARTTVNDFQEKLFNDLINSYAKQSPETITLESYNAKVDQINELFQKISRSKIESELQKALIKEGVAILR
jgi:hypothetical protein